jgi:hypothetical protein
MNVLALRWQVRSGVPPDASCYWVPELWVDGQPLADFQHLCVDLPALHRSLQAPGDYFLLTCWCGEPACAGLHRPVAVRHTPGGITWRMSEPQVRQTLCFDPQACAEVWAQGVREGMEGLALSSPEEPLALVPAAHERFLRRQGTRPQPLADAAMFKRIVAEVARQTGGQVEFLPSPQVTPNFHTARLSWRSGDALYLLASWAGHWACVAQLAPPLGRQVFVDPPEALSAALMQVAGVLPYDRAELNADFVRQPGMSEADVRYWRPRTLGEGLFNAWD